MVPDLLGLKGHEHRQCLGGQRPQGVDPPQAQGECRHQPIRLLPVQRGQLAQVLPGGGLEGFRVAVQFLLGVGQMHQRHHGEHHPLISGGEIVQHFSRFFPLLLQIVRDNSGEIVVIVLPPLPVGHVGFNPEQTALHLPDGLVRGHGDYINGQHHGAVEGRQLVHHGVLDVAGVLLQEQYPAIFAAHDEVVFLELEAIRTDRIFEGVTLPHQIPQVYLELGLLAGAVEVVEHPEPLHRVQLLAVGVQMVQPGGDVCRHPVEKCAGLLDALAVDRESDVPLLHHAVGAVRHLVHEHGIELGPVAVQVIVLAGDEDLLLEVLAVEPLVVDGELGDRTGVQGVEQFGITQEHGRFVLFGRDGIVDVGETDGFGELAPELKNPIRPQAADGDGVLDGTGDVEALPVLFECVLQGFNQCAEPPSRMNFQGLWRTGCPPGKPASWGTAVPSG